MGKNTNNSDENTKNGRVVVINPNSTKAVTEGIDAALYPLRFSDGPHFDCITIEEGPKGIATQRQVDGVVAPLCKAITKESEINKIKKKVFSAKLLSKYILFIFLFYLILTDIKLLLKLF